MKLEKAKKRQNIFKPNQNEMSKGIYKLEEQKSSIVSQAKYIKINGKGIPSMLAHIAKVSDRKVPKNSNLKILSPEQILQRL